jgi:hypothetical protein
VAWCPKQPAPFILLPLHHAARRGGVCQALFSAHISCVCKEEKKKKKKKERKKKDVAYN